MLRNSAVSLHLFRRCPSNENNINDSLRGRVRAKWDNSDGRPPVGVRQTRVSSKQMCHFSSFCMSITFERAKNEKRNPIIIKKCVFSRRLLHLHRFHLNIHSSNSFSILFHCIQTEQRRILDDTKSFASHDRARESSRALLRTMNERWCGVHKAQK